MSGTLSYYGIAIPQFHGHFLSQKHNRLLENLNKEKRNHQKSIEISLKSI